MSSRNSEQPTSQILLIGDDPNMLRTLRRNLVGRGYDVHIAFDDQECLAMATDINPDLCILILDFTTVNLDGLSVCEQLRQRTSVPIIALSTIGSSKFEIQVLDTGADDYLVMPFGMEKFLARVRSALRRSVRFQTKHANEDRMIISGDLIIDIESRQVIVHGVQVHLTPTEYSLLLYLAHRRGKVIPHRELLKAVWGIEYSDEREYLRVFISQIRHKIEEDPLRPVFILTEPGVGYRFRD
ncbi:MAG: response regulator transcription factor [Anaerolineales bacterium]|jgi:two-component system KDP operon response regulator KdpE